MGDVQSAGERVSPDTNALASHLQASIEVERSQLTRELHDDLGGLLVGALMDVAWVESRLDASDLRAKLRRAHDSLRTAVDLKRNLIESMRPTLLDNVGLFAAMRWHAARFCRAATIQCSIDIRGQEPTLKPDAAIAIYRIAEEALRLMSTALQARSVALHAEVHERVMCLQISHHGDAIAGDVMSTLPEYASMSHRIATLRGKIAHSQAPDGAALWSISVPVGSQEPT
ncbi:MAG TPA: histidine kinase [Steroidobacteraceae bacterium]|nr:histidine kinase [Steroidobacteraceae bacterium]